MRPKTIVAIILLALGVVVFAYQGIDYTTRGHGMDIGPMHVTTEREHHIPLPPIFGALALVGGIALLLADRSGGGRASAR